MLDNAGGLETSAHIITKNQNPRKVLHMRGNDRMAGSVPVWEVEKTAKGEVLQNLASADHNGSQSFEAALAYGPQDTDYNYGADEEFGFGDIVDMVNPLQHIPVVSYLYREITGDEIKPISRIIGGAAYGGAVGAATSLVNVIAEEETGRDIPGHVVAYVTGDDSAVSGNYDLARSSAWCEEARTAGYNNHHNEALGGALAYADLKHSNIETEVNEMLYPRMAGSGAARNGDITENELTRTSVREAITTVELSAMPARASAYKSHSFND